MKSMFKLFLTCVLVSGMSFAAKAQKFANALEYLEYITKEFTSIQSATWDYTRSAAKNKSAAKIDKQRQELIKTINAALTKIKKMGPHDGKTYFRDSTVAFLQLNLAVVSEDYSKIMDLEAIAEQSYDLMEAYLTANDLAGEKLEQAGNRIAEVEKQFAKENDITLIESNDKVTEKLINAGLVYDYYNPVYLIFFKSFKQEAYLMDALSKGDVSGMEQNRAALSKTSTEGLKQLETIQAYKNDASLKKACIEVLTFLQEEADKKFQVMIDFSSKQASYEKAKKTIESNKNRTQKEIDEFNKLGEEYNKSINEYNKINNELNNNRAKVINNWNNTAQNFTNKHIQ